LSIKKSLTKSREAFLDKVKEKCSTAAGLDPVKETQT
jgi:hypothetical protein